MNFAAEYAWNPHLTIYGRITNLTNEHYAEVFGFPALGTRGLQGSEGVRFSVRQAAMPGFRMRDGTHARLTI